MSKFLMYAAGVWVFFAFLIGVMMLVSPQKAVSVGSGSTKGSPVISSKSATEDPYKDVTTSVSIKDTPGSEGFVNTQVKVVP